LTDSPTAAAPQLVGRERALALTRELLLSAGMDVDVVGPRRSGRTSIVDAVAAYASSAQRPAVRVNGVRSLAATPLAALHAAGLGAGAGQERRAASPLQHAIDVLTGAVARSGAVVLVDDSDLVDDASTGAIDAVRRATGTPVLRTRARPVVAGDSGHVVELPPLSYDELAAAVAGRLGSPLDAATMSRLYALTFGNVGVALSTVQVAVVEGTIARRDGIWTADGELWSPSLRGLATDHLAHLTPTEISAAEAIALASADEAASLCARPDTALHGLLTTGIVKTIDHGGRNRLVLDPPLLREHFRRANDTAPAPEALFAQLVHEKADARREAAAEAWRRSPTPRSALALARALMAPSGVAPGGADDLAAVLACADESGDDPLALLALAELRARRALGSGTDLATASTALHAAAAALGCPYSRAADAVVALLAAEVGAMPQTTAGPPHGHRPEDEAELPPAVRARCLLAAQAVALQRGRFSDALHVHERIRTLPCAIARSLSDGLHGLALLGAGRSAEAIEWASRGAADARERLDVAAWRLHSLAAGLSHSIAGRTEDAADAIAMVGALGAPPVPGSAVEAGLRGLAAVIAAREGDLARAERIRSELAAAPAPQSTATEAALGWIDAALAAGRGRSDRAAALLHRLAGRLRANQQEAAAAFALLTALEHTAGEDGVEEARALVAGQQSELFDAHLAQVVARTRHDDDAPGALARRLRAVGLARLATASRDDTGFFTTPVVLTDREREIVRFVADGLVYREIAARLHLSARTVEGIAARIIRKLGLRDRRELAALALAGEV
jgi:DNA-binding NarL/FixJ family response regulator